MRAVSKEKRIVPSIIGFLGLFFLMGCNHPMVEDEAFDFILGLPKAERDFNQIVINAEDPSTFGYLTSGWHIPVPGKIPRTRFIWSKPVSSIVRFDINELEPMELILQIRPLVFEGFTEPLVDFLLNSQLLGAVQVAEDWRIYRLEIPSKLLLQGINQLEIRQPTGHRPSEIWPGSTDERLLGFSTAFMVIRPLRSPLQPDVLSLSEVLGYSKIEFKGNAEHLLHDGSDSTFSFRLKLPSNPILTFGVGIYPDSANLTRGRSKMDIEILDEATGMRDVVFGRTIRPPHRPLEMGWTSYRRSLQKYAGRDVKLIFKTSAIPTSTDHGIEGSWNGPMIYNRHLQYDILFIAGDAPDWPPENPGPDTHLGRFKSECSVLKSIPDLPAHVLENRYAGLIDPKDFAYPQTLVDSMIRDGWNAGLFYCDRNELLFEDRLSDSFDAMVMSSQEPESVAEMATGMHDWVRRLDQENYVLVFDPCKLETAFEDAVHESIFRWIYDWNLKQFSIVICYNIRAGHPVWIFQPEKLKKSDTGFEKTTSWEELESWIASFAQITIVR